MNTSFNINKKAALIICAGILTKIIPHLPNFSPEIVFALYLGMKSSKGLAWMYILFMAIVSDILFGWQNPAYPSFGSWTIFTYSALLAIGWAGAYIKKKAFGAAFMWLSCAANIAYWLWTNFGTWLVGNMYPHTITGFVACYTLALPFLANSLAASFAWCAIIVACEYYIPKNKLKHEAYITR
ncbi:MAG: hypothetical protein KBD83_05840 [Gammaproteobacteria bacterium]|nr:hypothetical protein [Gammaproteobacteria bacterium]